MGRIREVADKQKLFHNKEGGGGSCSSSFPLAAAPKGKKGTRKTEERIPEGGTGTGRDVTWSGRRFFIKFPSVPNPRTDFVGKTARTVHSTMNRQAGQVVGHSSSCSGKGLLDPRDFDKCFLERDQTDVTPHKSFLVYHAAAPVRGCGLRTKPPSLAPISLDIVWGSFFPFHHAPLWSFCLHAKREREVSSAKAISRILRPAAPLPLVLWFCEDVTGRGGGGSSSSKKGGGGGQTEKGHWNRRVCR